MNIDIIRRAALLLLSVALLCAACGKPGGKLAAGARAAVSELPLPVVPDSISDPAMRAVFVAGHFWDGLDFSDTSLSLDTAFVEQSFANFAAILQMLPESERAAAVGNALGAARADAEAYGFLYSTAERYLFDPGSPLYDETLFRHFLEYEISRRGVAGERERWQLMVTGKNTPGSKAPDFTFTKPDGTRGRLLLDGSGARVLLIFHEPGCDRCRELFAMLAADAALAREVAAGAMRVVAISQHDASDVWRSEVAAFPQGWEAGADEAGAIDAGELFIVRATPTVYLLGPDGTVIAKDMHLPS